MSQQSQPPFSHDGPWSDGQEANHGAERGATPSQMTGKSEALVLAVQRLVGAIRSNLPRMGETAEWAVTTWPIFRSDMAAGQAVQGQATFADLLNDVPENPGPDRLNRLTERLQNVEDALREVCRLMDSLSGKGLGRVRGLLRQLFDTPLYWWQWEGSTPAERGADGVIRPVPWEPVRSVLLPVDGDLLQEFREAAKDAASRDQGGAEQTEAAENSAGQTEPDQRERSSGVPESNASERVAVTDGGTPANCQELIQRLSPSVRKAYLALLCAERKAEKCLKYREAYELLKEEGIPENAGDQADLEDYELPDFPTWARYLGRARKALGEQKYQRRRGRSHGRSIVEEDQIERRPNDQ
jgi:hypothetical protein